MLKLYNTMTRKQDPFKPRGGDKKVRIFTCGASIYRRPHIGNYRTFLYEDILVRYLEYLGYSVDRVTNFTDVEDKAIIEAENQHQTVKQTTSAVAKHFFKESRLLKIKLPPEIPMSSTTVDGAVSIIEKLIKKGYAYWHKGNVFFDPLKFKDFGRLFRLDMRRWPKKKVRFSRDTYTGNRWNLGDFILWHGYRDGDSTWWDTAIGKGRPSWNIQDPAIIVEHLGYKVDINCGGIDNIYRHHDYNIAIMESLSGETYAKYYLHGAHLIVEGKTMSKSRGNILYPEDVLQKGYKPHHLRFFLISTHYRKKLNYNSRTIKRTAELLDNFRLVTARILKAKPEGRKDDPTGAELIEAVRSDFEAHMNSDLSVGTAFDSIYSHLAKLDKMREKGLLSQRQVKKLRETLERIDRVWNVIF